MDLVLEGGYSTAVIDFFKIGDVEQTGTEDLHLRVLPIFSVVINPDFRTLHTWISNKARAVENQYHGRICLFECAYSAFFIVPFLLILFPEAMTFYRVTFYRQESD